MKKRTACEAEIDSDETEQGNRPTSKIVTISRTISACQRCRTKKTKCDSNIPCSKCQKAGVECIGLDSTGRAVPRSYLVYLEDKVNILERLLEKHGIEFSDGDALRTIEKDDGHGQSVVNTGGGIQLNEQEKLKRLQAAESVSTEVSTPTVDNSSPQSITTSKTAAAAELSNPEKLNMQRTLSSQVDPSSLNNLKTPTPVPLQDPNDPSFYVGDSSGISFAKLLLTAVNFHPNHHSINHDQITTRPLANSHSESSTTSTANTSNNPSPTMTSSASGLKLGSIPSPVGSINSKQAKIMQLPSQSLAEQFIKQYFEQSNPQLPILHREEFIENYFNPIYGELSPDITLASNNTPISEFGKARNLTSSSWYQRQVSSALKPASKVNHLLEPEEIDGHLHKPLFFLFILFSVSTSINLQSHSAESSMGYRLQALQFMDSIYASDDKLECLQGLLLLTQHSIMRPTTPGVWYTLGTMLRLCVDLGLHSEKTNIGYSPFIKDLRRRLFWCAYSLDRQICLYLGRPFGIPEEAITSLYPIDLDDKFLQRSDEKDYQRSMIMQQSYKTVSIFFFKIRKIQSEILQILYFPNSQIPRPFHSLDHWKSQMESQIEQWYVNLPTSQEINCQFNKAFFELNYHHTKMLLFGITPKSQLPNWFKIHESSDGIIRTYGSLFTGKGVNYTWLTVHNLFMAGTSYLYAIYHSLEFLNVSYKGFKETVKRVCMVLHGLTDQCDAAESCLEIFKILAAGIEKLKFLQSGTAFKDTKRELSSIQQEQAHQQRMNNGPGSVSIQSEISPMFSEGDQEELTRFFDDLQAPDQTTANGSSFSMPSFTNGVEPQQWNNQPSSLGQYQNLIPNLNQRQIHQNNSQSQATSYPHDINQNIRLQPPPSLRQNQVNPSVNGQRTTTIPQYQETERVFDLMNQVSMDSIWDQFFQGKAQQQQHQQQQSHQRHSMGSSIGGKTTNTHPKIDGNGRSTLSVQRQEQEKEI